MDYVAISNVLLGAITILLSVVAYFAKRAYEMLTSNQAELFNRTNKLENRVSSLETACDIRHGG